MARNPTLTPTLRRDMADVVANGAFTYINEFTRELFPDYRAPNVQALIVDGLADAIRRYGAATGVPIAQTLALTLIDNKEPRQ